MHITLFKMYIIVLLLHIIYANIFREEKKEKLIFETAVGHAKKKSMAIRFSLVYIHTLITFVPRFNYTITQINCLKYILSFFIIKLSLFYFL